jgi:hypothetical protein
MVRSYWRVLSSPCTKTCAPLTSRSAVCAKPAPNATTLCHCVLSFHSSFSSFHDFFVALAELYNGCAVREVLGFCVLANKSDDRELIEVHIVYSFFLPCLLGHPEAKAAAPKPSECFLGETERISFLCLQRACERYKAKLFGWFRRKQSERRVPGAGFSPAAVPSNPGTEEGYAQNRTSFIHRDCAEREGIAGRR